MSEQQPLTIDPRTFTGWPLTPQAWEEIRSRLEIHAEALYQSYLAGELALHAPLVEPYTKENPVPCAHCGRLCIYVEAFGDYQHLDEDAPDCFFIQRRDETSGR